MSVQQIAALDALVEGSRPPLWRALGYDTPAGRAMYKLRKAPALTYPKVKARVHVVEERRPAPKPMVKVPRVGCGRKVEEPINCVGLAHRPCRRAPQASAPDPALTTLPPGRDNDLEKRRLAESFRYCKGRGIGSLMAPAPCGTVPPALSKEELRYERGRGVEAVLQRVRDLQKELDQALSRGERADALRLEIDQALAEVDRTMGSVN